jgi:internalin A
VCSSDLLDDPSIQVLGFYRGTFSDLSPLTALTDLEELDITSNRNVTDISPLVSLVNLKKLILFETGIESIEPISSLVNLRHLEIIGYADRYYRELLSLQHLEILNLHNQEPLDVTYIAQLSTLRDLEISPGYTRFDAEILNIELLRNLANLERLVIHFPSDINLTWIAGLRNLTELELRGDTISDIRPLLELPNLVTVNLYGTEVRDLSPLLESTSIKRIIGPVTSKQFEDGVELRRQFRARGIELSAYEDYR